MARLSNDYGRRAILKAVGSSAVVAGLAGCIAGNGGDDDDSSQTDDDAASDDKLTIGVYAPLSGPAADIGEALQQGAELAAEEVNDDGGVAGTEIELLFGDSESDPAQGRNAVEYMIDVQNADMIAGGFHSDVTLAVIEVTHDRGIPQMISNSVSGSINQKIEEEGMDNVFKMSPPDEAYGLGFAEFFDSLQESGDGYFPYDDQTVAMIAEDTSYGLDVMDATQGYIEDAGWDVISTDDVEQDEADFSSLLARIRSDDPDIVWAVQTAPSSAGSLIQQFQQTGFSDTHFMHTFAPSNPQTIEIAGDAADGVLWMANIDIIPQFADDIGLTAAWEEKYGGVVPGSSGSLGYDNIHLIGKAVSDLGGMEELTVETWNESVIEMETTKGSVGYYNFDENNQAKWGIDYIPPVAFQIRDQESHMVWPFDYAEEGIDNSYY